MKNINKDCSYYHLRDFKTHKLDFCCYYISYDMDCFKCPYRVKSSQLELDLR